MALLPIPPASGQPTPGCHIPEYFFDPMPTKDRFVKGDKPVENTFKKFCNSITFKLRRSDRAKTYSNTDPKTIGIQGLVVKNTDNNAKTRTNPIDLDTNQDPYSYSVDAENLPEVKGIPAFDPLLPFDPAFDDPVITPLGGFPTLTAAKSIYVTEDITTNTRNSIWKPVVSNKFFNWLWSCFGLIVDDITAIENNVNSAWIEDQMELKIYNIGEGLQDTFVNGYTSGTGYVKAKYKIVSNMIFISYDINLAIADFANPGLNMVYFDFIVTNGQLATIDVAERGMGYVGTFPAPLPTNLTQIRTKNPIGLLSIRIHEVDLTALSSANSARLYGQAFYKLA